jgi:hypothetical protein
LKNPRDLITFADSLPSRKPFGFHRSTPDPLG